MGTLVQWLKAEGLERYTKLFADNDIDFETLAELTDDDLEKLGVSLGHRRKLQKALEVQRRAAAGPATTSAAVAPVATAGLRDAERRQVTVLLCDLVGSTELANVLDPEDTSALIRRYQDACAGAITRFDGFVAKFMGDGVLAYFGYPRASEDAAEQAVRSSFAVIETVNRIARPDGQPCRVRIAVATGVVVIGDIIGAGSSREHSIVGETPNLAARLHALAEPDTVVVGQTTRQLLGRTFECVSLGEHPLKGYANPVSVSRVVREVPLESRFAAHRSATRGSVVGRGKETASLQDQWSKVLRGHGHATLISGDAGIGKSRLVDALIDGIGAGPYSLVTAQCSPYHANSALYPVIGYLERAARFAVADSEAARLEKLEALIAPRLNGSTGQSMTLIAELLSLPTEGFTALDLSPPQRKVATITALLDLLVRLAEAMPVLAVLEDAHWCDPTTLDLWTRLIGRIGSSRVLVVITARPEFVSPWMQGGLVGSMELVSLTALQAAELVAEIAAPQALGPELVDDIVGKADGVPLYVEELTKAVLESSTLERSSVPATLHDSLMARLDRLGPAKEIAQVAAVIGQEFPLALLAAVTPYTTVELEIAIAPLVEAGLAFRQGRSTEPTYSFRHALLRDVAYENLLRARRQHLHDNIARALESNFVAVATAEPELLAHHFHHAGRFNLAADYRERAGERALSRSAFAEAVAHFTAALAEVEKLSDEAGHRASRELVILLALGPPLSIIKGAQSREVEEVYRRAHDNATLLNNEEGLFKATWGLWYNSIIGRLDTARDYAEELLRLGRNSADDNFLLEGFHCRWSTAQFRGDFPTALRASQEGIDRYDRARHSWMGPVFGGHDPGVCAHGVKALTLAMQGRNGAARSAVVETLALAEALKHPNTRTHSLLAAMTVAQVLGDFAAVTEYTQRALALADKYDLLPIRSHATFMSGAALASGSDLDAGMAVMESEFQRASAVGPYLRFYSALLAEGRRKSGRFSDALALLRSALATVTEPGVGLFVPELYRLQGLCLLAMDPASKGEAMRSLDAAVDFARQQHALLLELRGAVSRARAAIAIGQPTECLEALQTLVHSLTVEFDADNLIEARELLTAERGVTL